MAWTLTNVTTSVDLSAFVDLGVGLIVVDRAYAETSRMSGVIRDEAGTISLAVDHELLLTDGGSKVFAGHVRQLRKGDTGVSGQRLYSFECQDYTTYLADDYVPAGAGVRANAESDSARIAWLFATFGTKGVVIGAAVQTLKAVMPDQDFSGKNLHQCLTMIAAITGGSFYVDYDKGLHSFTSEVNAASFGLSDNPNGSTTFGYERFAEASDTVDFVNEVHVIGAPGISATRYLGGSPPAAGARRATVVEDSEILTVADANARGDAIIAQYGVVRKPSSLVTFKPGLRAGQYVQVTHAGWSISASYRIAGLVAKPVSKDRIEYEVDFGNAPVDLSSLLSGTLGVASDATAAAAQAANAASLASGVDLSVGGSNLVPNSSFEDGTSWIVGINWAIGFTPTGGELPFHGTDVARSQIAAETAADLVTQKIAVDRGDEYVVSFWRFMRSRSSGTFRAFVKQYNAANTLLATTNVDFAAVDTEWERVLIRFAPAASVNPTKIAWQTTTAKIEIGFNSAGANGTYIVDVDGVQLERGQLPTAYAPMPREILPGSIAATEIADDSITTPKIVAEAIVAAKIAAGAISADKLAATLVLGSLIRAGSETANRVEFDSNGFRVYNALGDLLVNIPTDNSPVYVNAEIVASTLQVLGNSTFRGVSNVLAAGAALILGSKVEAPDQAPTLAQGWQALAIPHDAAVDEEDTDSRFGLAYDAAGGAGGATKVFWTIAKSSATSFRLVEMLATTRAVNRSTLVYSSLIDAAKPPSVVRHSTWVYVLLWDYSGLAWQVKRYVASTMALANTYTPVLPGSVEGFAPQSPVITSDGTNLYIVDAPNTGNPTDTISWNKYDASMVKVGSTADGGDSLAASDRVRAAYVGNADIGAGRMFVAAQSGNVSVMDLASLLSTGFNEGFAVTAGSRGLTYGDALGDGARFFHLPGPADAGQLAIQEHSTWTWTTASAKYWVAYTWYDSVGTTHETTLSPRASITMGRRKYLTVTGLAVPIGLSDDPDNRRIYMVPSATTPATSSLDLQATSPLTTVVLSTYNAAGAAPPTSNNFPAATPSEIRSAGSEWRLLGDGSIVLESGTYTPVVGGIGTGTNSTAAGEWIRWGKFVHVRIYLICGSNGTGSGNVTVTTPTDPDRTTRQMLSGNSEGHATAGSITLVALSGGSGNVWDRIRDSNGGNMIGTEYDSGGIIIIEGTYVEA